MIADIVSNTKFELKAIDLFIRRRKLRKKTLFYYEDFKQKGASTNHS